MKKTILIAILILCAILALVVWTKRYSLLFHYYAWQLEHTNGELREDFTDNINSIAPQIIPLLVKTFEDPNSSCTRRFVAANGLIKADKIKAEVLFINSLENKKDEIVEVSILELGFLKNKNNYEKVLKFSTHPHPILRMATIDYLGNFKDSESIAKIKYMMDNDPDANVRVHAANVRMANGQTEKLYKIGIFDADPRHQ